MANEDFVSIILTSSERLSSTLPRHCGKGVSRTLKSIFSSPYGANGRIEIEPSENTARMKSPRTVMLTVPYSSPYGIYLRFSSCWTLRSWSLILSNS